MNKRHWKRIAHCADETGATLTAALRVPVTPDFPPQDRRDRQEAMKRAFVQRGGHQPLRVAACASSSAIRALSGAVCASIYASVKRAGMKTGRQGDGEWTGAT